MANFDLEQLQRIAHELEDDFTEEHVHGFWDGVIAVAKLSGDEELYRFAMDRGDRWTP